MGISLLNLSSILMKKIRLITYVFDRKSYFLYMLLKTKTLKGIIIPETYFNV